MGDYAGGGWINHQRMKDKGKTEQEESNRQRHTPLKAGNLSGKSKEKMKEKKTKCTGFEVELKERR